MPINFIPNDPKTIGLAPMRRIKPSPDASSKRCGFSMSKLPAEKPYDVGSEDFLAWQTREAALRTVSAFESWFGKLEGWRGKSASKRIRIDPVAGVDLNAYYDRYSVGFYKAEAGSRTIYTGASADIVSHEVGHGILDAIRPQLWDVSYMEVGAFHEGFGDCMSIMLALSDKDIRKAVLKQDPHLDKGNFVEAWGEDMGAAAKAMYGASDNSAGPRRGLNTYFWDLPKALPDEGGPKTMIDEEHSMGQLLSGCYYDLIREIFSASSSKTEQALLKAAKTATILLATAAQKATITPRFFQSVGRTMLVVDDDLHGGANVGAIQTAYTNHRIAIGAATLLAPHVSLESARSSVRARSARTAKTARAGSALISSVARASLSNIIGAPDAGALTLHAITLGGQALAMANAERRVDLSGVATGLRGVSAYAPRAALVGGARGASAILGSVEAGGAVEQEVRDYVATLAERGAIDFSDAAKRGRKRGGSGARKGAQAKTHEVAVENGEKVLRRKSFVCQCCVRRGFAAYALRR